MSHGFQALPGGDTFAVEFLKGQAMTQEEAVAFGFDVSA